MTTPSHILVIQSKPPKDRTKEERQMLVDHQAARAALFGEILKAKGLK